MKTLAPLGMTLVCLLALGCDQEHSTLEYDAVARIELDAVRDSAWMAPLLDADSIEFEGDLGPECADVLQHADAVTIGFGSGKGEVYVEGAPKTTAQCFAPLVAEANEGKTKAEARFIGGGVYAVVVGEGASLPVPSRRRMRELAAGDPSGAGGQPIWFTLRDPDDTGSLQYAEAWVDPRKGLTGHASAQFRDLEEAGKLSAQIGMALVGMRLSEETSALAKAVTFRPEGDTLTFDVAASAELMKRVTVDGTTSVGARKTTETDEPSGASFSIELGE